MVIVHEMVNLHSSHVYSNCMKGLKKRKQICVTVSFGCNVMGYHNKGCVTHAAGHFILINFSLDF